MYRYCNFFKLHIFAACCYKIRVAYTTGHGNKGAHIAINHRYGYYYSQRGTYGGKSWYKSSDGKSAVWYRNRQWNIGAIRRVGSGVRNAYVSSSKRCPYGTGYSWRFYSENLESFYNAGKTLSIWCKS